MGSTIIGSAVLPVNFALKITRIRIMSRFFFLRRTTAVKTVRSFKRDTWNLSLGDSCADKWTVNRGIAARARHERVSLSPSSDIANWFKPYRNFFQIRVKKKNTKIRETHTHTHTRSPVRDERPVRGGGRGKGREMKHVWTLRAA